jgi:hypothetical protein
MFGFAVFFMLKTGISNGKKFCSQKNDDLFPKNRYLEYQQRSFFPVTGKYSTERL